MINELINIFRTNFPFIIREEKTVRNILENKNNKFFEKRNNNDELIGVSVVNKNTIIMLCVNKEYRNQGFGTELLKLSESYIKSNGYDNVVVGLGFDYLTPGIPTSKKVLDLPSIDENINESLTDEGRRFFEKRGYYHDNSANIFDMKMNSDEYNDFGYNIGNTINGYTYNFVSLDDIKKVVDCSNDAEESFSKYYNDEFKYSNNNVRILKAEKNNEVCGAIMISCGVEEVDLGSVGCTIVRNKDRHQKIATILTNLGTKYLIEKGYKRLGLNYTYTGLDNLYGGSGYKICNYYFMARKDL